MSAIWRRLHPGLAPAALLVGLVVSGCVRDIGDLPEPPEGGFLTGTVVERSLETGELLPVEGAVVRVRGRSAVARTDADGQFRLERLALGPAEVVVERRDDRGVVRAARHERLLVEGQALSVGTLRISRDVTVSGRVVEPDPGEPQLRVPAEGAIVVIPGTPYEAVVSSRGFSLVNLPPGVFDVAALRPGLEAGRRFGVDARRDGEEVALSEIVLERPLREVRVIGKASLESASSSAGIRVRFDRRASGQASPPVEASTEGDGLYEVTLTTGLYRVRLEADGFIPLEVGHVVVLPEVTLGLDAVTLSVAPPGDQDADGTPDELDPDRDNDGCSNEADTWPDDGGQCADTDGDRTSDDRDEDDDGDDLSDAEEVSPGRDGFLTDPLLADTDGDGLTDAVDPCPTVSGSTCDASPGAPGQLRVSGFSPAQVSPGDVLRILGERFPDPNEIVVRFSGDALALPLPSTATATSVEVLVPDGARTGPLEIQVAAQRILLREPLEVRERLVIARIVPQPVAPDAVVALYLRGAVASQAAVRFDDGPSVPPFACTEPQRDDALAGESVVCRRVPAGVQIVEVFTATLSARSPIAVQPVPVVERIEPTPAVRGGPIRLLGRNLFAGGTVEVVFTSTSGSPLPVTASSVTSEAIEVVVPDAAAEGVLALRHPVATVFSAARLVLDDTRVLAFDMRPLMLLAGLTNVSITGRNLQDVDRVVLPGDLEATNVRASRNEVVFDVPASASLVPGPVRLGVGGSATLLGAPFRMQVIRQVSSFPAPPETTMVAGPPSLVQGYKVTFPSGVVVHDLDTGRQELLPFPFSSDGGIRLVRGTRLVAVNQPAIPELWFVDLDTSSRAATCARPTGSSPNLDSLSEDPLRRFVFLNDVERRYLYRYDITRRRCDVLAFPVANAVSLHFESPNLHMVIDPAPNTIYRAENWLPDDGLADGTTLMGPIGLLPHRGGSFSNFGAAFLVQPTRVVVMSRGGDVDLVQGGVARRVFQNSVGASTMNVCRGAGSTSGGFLFAYDGLSLFVYDTTIDRMVLPSVPLWTGGSGRAYTCTSATQGDRLYLEVSPITTVNNVRSARVDVFELAR